MKPNAACNKYSKKKTNKKKKKIQGKKHPPNNTCKHKIPKNKSECNKKKTKSPQPINKPDELEGKTNEAEGIEVRWGDKGKIIAGFRTENPKDDS
jgi:hypothetical protein